MRAAHLYLDFILFIIYTHKDTTRQTAAEPGRTDDLLPVGGGFTCSYVNTCDGEFF